ncbi:MAG: DUF523 domain-containing protein [Nitrospiraceae bacterium]|nr:DUF523 domain-containing protein [Nitrospiraceae bacterium]
MYLVSACLAGLNTRYNGENSLNETVKALVLEGRAIPVCPEQLGGLPTPRPAAQFDGGDGSGVLEGRTKVLSVDEGADCTGAFLRGAREVLRIARLYGADEAILKDGSPSCGVLHVRSRGEKIKGRGVAAELLRREGLKVTCGDTL